MFCGAGYHGEPCEKGQEGTAPLVTGITGIGGHGRCEGAGTQIQPVEPAR